MSTEEMKPLKRLLDDPEISGELRADLLTAQSFHVPFDAAAGLSRLQAHLDSVGGAAEPATPSSGHAAPLGAAPSAAMQLTGGKIIAALALAAGLGWGALELT